jgi:hypothetical protein
MAEAGEPAAAPAESEAAKKPEDAPRTSRSRSPQSRSRSRSKSRSKSRSRSGGSRSRSRSRSPRGGRRSMSPASRRLAERRREREEREGRGARGPAGRGGRRSFSRERAMRHGNDRRDSPPKRRSRSPPVSHAVAVARLRGEASAKDDMAAAAARPVERSQVRARPFAAGTHTPCANVPPYESAPGCVAALARSLLADVPCAAAGVPVGGPRPSRAGCVRPRCQRQGRSSEGRDPALRLGGHHVARALHPRPTELRTGAGPQRAAALRAHLPGQERDVREPRARPGVCQRSAQP